MIASGKGEVFEGENTNQFPYLDGDRLCVHDRDNHAAFILGNPVEVRR